MTAITLEEIRALPAEVTQNQSTQEIADALSIGRTKLVKTEIGKLTVLSALGMEAGNALLDIIDTVDTFRHIRYPLANGWLDLADPAARAMLDTLCSAENAQKLKSLAEHADMVDEYEVRKLCWSAEGGWLV